MTVRTFHEEPSEVARVNHLSATEDEIPQKEGKLTTESQVENYLLATYATGNVIAEAKAEFENIKQSELMSAIRYSEDLLEEAI